MVTASVLFKLNAALSNLATAVDKEQQSATALYVESLWQQCVALNPQLDTHCVIPSQEVFLEPVMVHTLVRLQSAVASYVSATFLNQVHPRQLKLIKYYLELICEQRDINHEPLLK